MSYWWMMLLTVKIVRVTPGLLTRRLEQTSGAGMGVDSGLPDFRGKEGFWKAYPALARANMCFTRIPNPASFTCNPELAWGFYGHRLNLYRDTVPHTGFHLLIVMASRLEKGHFVYTSNVDGQFQKAGFTSDRIVECHGSIHRMQCLVPCSRRPWRSRHPDCAGPRAREENRTLDLDQRVLPKCAKSARHFLVGWKRNSRSRGAPCTIHQRNRNCDSSLEPTMPLAGCQ